ncbi:hypothetical protein DXU03_26025 [Rhizobium johnstonii]
MEWADAGFMALAAGVRRFMPWRRRSAVNQLADVAVGTDHLAIDPNRAVAIIRERPCKTLAASVTQSNFADPPQYFALRRPAA